MAKTDNRIQLNKNDYIEVLTDDNGCEGEGIAHYNGKTIFIKNAIKGENVRAKIILCKSNYYIAIVDKILVPSPHRVKPPCPYFNKCGGCSCQHIDYEYQCELKYQALKITLLKQGIEPKEYCPLIRSPLQYNYRNKLSLPVRNKENHIGFFAQKSHRLIDIDGCLLQNFNSHKLIKIMRDFMSANSLYGYEEDSGRGDIRHLVARSISGVLVIAVVATRPLKRQLKALDGRLQTEYGDSYALYSNINNKNTNIIFSPDFEFIGGNEATASIDGLKIKVHPASFFQVNDGVKNMLYAAVCESIKSDKFPDNPATKNIIIDAFAGAGILSARLASFADTVYSVEINNKAHSAALQLAEDNKISNLKCIPGDCSAEVIKIINIEKNSSITVVLDPPRSGISTGIVTALNSNNIKKIIYISCNPSTLARDLKLLSAYTAVSVTPFDMFPQTPDLETLTVLERK